MPSDTKQPYPAELTHLVHRFAISTGPVGASDPAIPADVSRFLDETNARDYHRFEFSENAPEPAAEQGWSSQSYTRDADESLPELHLTIHRHNLYGANLAFNSRPFREEYHFGTGKAVPQSDVAGIIHSYMRSIAKKKKFEGS